MMSSVMTLQESSTRVFKLEYVYLGLLQADLLVSDGLNHADRNDIGKS